MKARFIVAAALALMTIDQAVAANSGFLVQATIVQPVNVSIHTETSENTSLITTPSLGLTSSKIQSTGTGSMQLSISGPADRNLSVSTSSAQVAVCTQIECVGDHITIDNIHLSGDISENGNGMTNSNGLIPAAIIDSHVAIPDDARPGEYTASTIIHIAFS